MNQLDILYDHYKESNELSHFAQKQRSKYFFILCILEILNFIFLIQPSQTFKLIKNWLNVEYSIEFPYTISIIQVILWIFIVYFTVLYFQKNIFIERQYRYLNELENDISVMINLNCFCREGNNYNDNYPFALTMIDFFYKWTIPVILIILNFIKLVFEFINMLNLPIVLFDTACCFFIIILTCVYIKMINFPTNI